MNKRLIIACNGTDWGEKSLSLLKKNESVFICNQKIPINGRIKSILARGHFSYTINERINLPFKSMWFRSIDDALKVDVEEGEDKYLLFYDRNRAGGEESYLRHLRKKYPHYKYIYIFTNIVKHSAAGEHNYLNRLNDWYDVVFAFDPEDAKKYNFSYSPLIYDADPSYKKAEKESSENLVFYVGQAKDRLDGLLSCYEKLISLSIKSDFHIANVPEGQMKYADDIVYNKFISYDEAVDSIQRATCLIDVIQGDSTGLTIKVCEAICYDKKLITTNKHIADYPFYDPRFIRIVESPDDIDEAFFNENRDVHYPEEGKRYFSAESFLERLEAALERKS